MCNTSSPINVAYFLQDREDRTGFSAGRLDALHYIIVPCTLHATPSRAMRFQLP